MLDFKQNEQFGFRKTYDLDISELAKNGSENLFTFSKVAAKFPKFKQFMMDLTGLDDKSLSVFSGAYLAMPNWPGKAEHMTFNLLHNYKNSPLLIDHSPL